MKSQGKMSRENRRQRHGHVWREPPGADYFRKRQVTCGCGATATRPAGSRIAVQNVVEPPRPRPLRGRRQVDVRLLAAIEAAEQDAAHDADE